MPLYRTARADFEWLERLAELDDQVDLDSQREALMQNPTKAHATELYCQAISLWLHEHKDEFVGASNVAHIEKIRRRYATYL